MNILNISKEDLFHYLTNNNCIGQGCIGRISIYDENTLIKIYYKELIDTYISKDFNYLDEEIDIKISVKEELLDDNILPNQKEIELSFTEIENILGFELPNTALTNIAWWNWTPKSNNNNREEHPHAKNWNAIGWHAKFIKQGILFSNRYYISDDELKRLELSIPEYEFYQNYSRKHVYKVDIAASDWLVLLNSKEEIFTSDLPQLHKEDGSNTFWPYLFWGKYVDNHKHFEWLLRPELVIALRKKFPYLENQEGNRFLDEQLNNEITSSPVPVKLEEETSKPKVKVETVFNNGHEGYPRSRNVTYVALDKANYTCEFEPSHKSFINKSTGKKYMEAHHLIPLAFHKSFENSLDHIANVICLCSECHNRIHYGADADLLITKLFMVRKERLEEAGIGITLERLLEMYKNNN